MKFKIFFTVLALSVACMLAAENSNSFGMDDAIDKKIRKDIRKKNAMIIGYLQDNRQEEMYELLSKNPSYKQSFSEFRGIFNYVSEFPRKYKLKVFHEYYSAGTDTKVHYLKDFSEGGEAYRIESDKPVYMSLLVNKAKANENQYLMTVLYHYVDGDWQLLHLYVSQNRIAGKDFTELINEAAEFEKKGQFFPAYFRSVGAELISRPVPFIIFETKDERILKLEDFRNRFKKKVPLPMKVKELPSVPVVIGFNAEFSQDGPMPVVSYITGIPLDEEHVNEIEKEKDMLAEYLVKKYPSLAAEFKILLFVVYDSDPAKNEKNVYYKTRHYFK